MDTLLIFFLNRLFVDKVEKNQKPVREFLPFLYSVYGEQNFKFIGITYATLIGWILYTFQDTSTRLN